MKLVAVRRSTRPGKKLMAAFDDGTVTHFGATGYQDYTTYWARDPAEARRRRRQYIARHSRAEDWRDPRAAGTLARYVLWERPTVKEAVTAYRRRFGV